MAYDKDEVYKRAIEAIKVDDDITFIQDVYVEIGISHQTFYRFFPKESDEYETIKRLLERNQTRIKRNYRRNWKDPNASAVLQLANYKLIATQEELERLNPPKEKADEKEQKPIKIEGFQSLEQNEQDGNDSN